MNDQAEPRPLARLVREANERGVSFREMERRATRAGFAMSHSQFNDYASDVVAKVPLKPQISALAAGTGRPKLEVQVAVLEQFLDYTPEVLTDVAEDGSVSGLIPADMPEEERQRLSKVIKAYVESWRDSNP